MLVGGFFKKGESSKGFQLSRMSLPFLNFHHYIAENEKKKNLKLAKEKATEMANEAAKKGSCVLGTCQILMSDFSTKSIKEIKRGDEILDGSLNPVTVNAINTSFLGPRKMYQLNENGPIFTPEHQFYTHLGHGHVGVVSRTALLKENPQLEERIIFEMEELKTLLQFEEGQVRDATFKLHPYLHDELPPNTVVYFLITSGTDGSYIVDDFVSRHELPDFYSWPLTYATLGLVVLSSKISLPVDTLENDAILASTIEDLVKLWKLTIYVHENCLFEDETFESSGDDFFFNYQDVLENSHELVAEIVSNPSKMRAAQYLNMFGAKVLHDILDDEKTQESKRFSLMRTLISVSQTFFDKIPV